MAWRRILPPLPRRRRGRPGDEVIPGSTFGQTIEIDRLIYPLRYDVQVRIDFIRLLRDEWALYETDLPGFLDRPAARAYRTWFGNIGRARLFARSDRGPEFIEDRFLKRVRQTAMLWQAIDRDGYDLSIPIGLRSGRTIRMVHGKQIASTVFAGDGCHRLACLYVLGQTRLEPAHYLLRVRRDLQPLDNTAILIDLQVLDRETYLAFISRFYCDGRVLGSASEIRAHVAAAKPALLPELDSVFAFDLPRFA